MRLCIVTALAFFMLDCSLAVARTVPISGGTFTIIPVHGDPIRVSSMEIEDDLILYTLDTGQEKFIQMGNVANIEEVFDLLVVKSDEQPAEIPAPAVQEQASSSGDAVADLGHQDVALSTADQAKALLGLMERQPGKASYQIIHQVGEEVVVFGLDQNKDSLSCLRQRMDGTGTKDRWEGHALQRLQSAANGGSLDDTPDGKAPVTIEQIESSEEEGQ